MMQPSEMFEDLKNIIKQGYLEKQSKFLKSWRKRWFVLTQTSLYTFKAEKQYKNPTEIIPLKSILIIKCLEEKTKRANCFTIVTQKQEYIINGNSHKDREQWIGSIGKALVKSNLQNQSTRID